jgi:hypothetical protein
MKRGVIDRFEEDIAVIDINGVTVDVPKVKLPPEAKPGDSIIIDGEVYRMDANDTAKRKSEIDRLMDDLFK